MASTDPVHVLRGHSGDVQSLAFLSEEHLYAGDSNGEMRLWDLAACRTEFVTRLHDVNAGILQLACLPSFGVLISQGRDGCVKLWAVGRTGALDRSQPLHEFRTESFNFCRCAVWAPGTAGAAAAAAASAFTGATTSIPPNVSGDLRGILLACAAHDPADIALWRPAEGRTATLLLRPGGPGGSGGSETKHGMCMSLAFLGPPNVPLPIPEPSQPSQQQHDAQAAGRGAGGAEPASAAAPGASSDAPSGHGLSTDVAGEQRCPGAVGSCIGESGGSAADPRFIAAGYEDGVVALWDVRSPARPLASLRVHGEPVMCVGVRARTRGPKRAVDTERRERRGGLDAATAGEARCGAGEGGSGSERDCEHARAETPTGGTVSYDLVSGSADDQISCCVVRPAAARPLALEQQLRLREAGTADVRIRADGKLFACGCWDGRVRLFSLRRREPLAVLKYHRSQVTSVAFSPGTNTIASASRDTTIALWSVYASGSTTQ